MDHHGVDGRGTEEATRIINISFNATLIIHVAIVEDYQWNLTLLAQFCDDMTGVWMTKVLKDDLTETAMNDLETVNRTSPTQRSLALTSPETV
jgi:hypothetical protein